MTIRQSRASGRSGATAVEFAFVVMPMLAFFFGVCEYGRFYLDRNVLNNAAREACRYALANNYTDGSVNTSVTNIVNSYMAGRKTDFSSFTVALSGTTSGGTNYTGSNVSNLQPGDSVTVSITATYLFMAPTTLLGLPSTTSMNSTVTMLVEGVT